MAAPPLSVVCLGSSAGGLSALKEFFACMVPDSGRAFIVIQHLPANGPTLTRDILARVTTMAVLTARDQQRVRPNQVYTMPPGTRMIIAGGRLGVTPRTETAYRHKPIDRFLKSLAIDCGEHAIAVVLSGYDGDGSEGVIAIKAHGGSTYAQDGTADVCEMPASAQATGCVDQVLDVRRIAEAIAHAPLPGQASAMLAGSARHRPSDLLGSRTQAPDP